MLVGHGATPEPVEVGPSRCLVTGTMPTSEVGPFERRLPDLTSGRGVLLTQPAGHVPVHGSPTRGAGPSRFRFEDAGGSSTTAPAL